MQPYTELLVERMTQKINGQILTESSSPQDRDTERMLSKPSASWWVQQIPSYGVGGDAKVWQASAFSPIVPSALSQAPALKLRFGGPSSLPDESVGRGVYQPYCHFDSTHGSSQPAAMAARLLPIREVNRCAETLVRPLRPFEFPEAQLPMQSLFSAQKLESSPRGRRRRRKLRNFADCGFCQECALPFLDGVFCCLSTLLIPCLDVAVPPPRKVQRHKPVPPRTLERRQLGALSDHLYPEIFYYSQNIPPAADPTLDTICLQCGDIVQSKSISTQFFAKLLKNGVNKVFDANDRRKDEKSEGKIPLPSFSLNSQKAASRQVEQGKRENKSEARTSDARLSSSRKGKHLSFPKDEGGKVILPAFLVEKNEVRKKQGIF